MNIYPTPYYSTYEDTLTSLRAEHYENCEDDVYRKMLVRNRSFLMKVYSFFAN